MFYDNEAWLKFREESLTYSRIRERAVIKEWLDKIGYAEPVGYYLDNLNNVMEIYSTRPGVLIGKAGVPVEELEKMLLDEYGRKYQIKYVEIRGGFVNV